MVAGHGRPHTTRGAIETQGARRPAEEAVVAAEELPQAPVGGSRRVFKDAADAAQRRPRRAS